MNDFYAYDPATNTWEKKADFKGTARYGAVGFVVDGKGYMGSGYDGNYLKDFYEYSPSTDTWTQIVSIGGSKRFNANSFVLESKGYVISGLDNGSYLSDMWSYNPSTGSWSEMRKIYDADDDNTFDDDYTSIARINAVGLEINGKGYLATGGTGTLLSTVWEYDPATDLWVERTSFEGLSRTDAVGFSIGSRGYVTTGRSSSYYLDDIWSFDPKAEYDEDN
jgi:N-acetylneuraminic acid mutarotase